MTGWVVITDLVDDGWWCTVELTGGTDAVGVREYIEDGPYPTEQAALDAGHKIAYDFWVEVVE